MNIAIVCEAAADRRIAQDLMDRVLVDQVNWLEEDQLDSQRSWISEATVTDTTADLLWKNIKLLAAPLRIKIHGHFNGESGLPDASIARRAIAVLLKIFDLDAVMLVRDADKQPDRRGGLEQARECFKDRVTAVIGFADPEREAWVLSGFDPKDDYENQTLADEKKRLGFDPCLKSRDLTATNDDQAKKSPKRVVKALTRDCNERESLCWKETSLEVLKARGDENGLASFLEEVRIRIAPMISGEQNPRI